MNSTPVKQEIVSLFPTPLMLIRGLLSGAEVTAIREFIYSAACEINASSENLFHTKIFSDAFPSSFLPIEGALLPQIELLGGILLGQKLVWSITGMWGNLAMGGSHQMRHNHANSIISGIIYLAHEDDKGTTRFHRPHSDNGFLLENNNGDVDRNIFNATTWSLESACPGDALLFPSFLSHQVPKVVGPDRLTVAFNAIPDQLDCSGYTVRFHQRPSRQNPGETSA